jgi:hypothetical protein
MLVHFDVSCSLDVLRLSVQLQIAFVLLVLYFFCVLEVVLGEKILEVSADSLAQGHLDFDGLAMLFILEPRLYLLETSLLFLVLVDAVDKYFLLTRETLANDFQYAIVVLEAKGHLLDVQLLRYHDFAAHLQLRKEYLLAQADAFE